MQVADLYCKSSLSILIDRYREGINSLPGYVENDPLYLLRPLNGLAKLRFAAVFVGLQFRNGCWSFLLTLRKSHLRVNGGEVCFPGGKFDKNVDSSIVDTALRESREEIGLHKDKIQLIGQIPPIISRGGFLVHLVLGIIDDGFIPVPNKSEVEDILYVTALDIISPNHHRQLTDKHCGVELTADYFDIDYDGHMYTIYGLTAAALTVVCQSFFDLDMDCQLCRVAKVLNEKNGGSVKMLMKFLENFNSIAKM